MAEENEMNFDRLGVEYINRSVSPNWRETATLGENILAFLRSIGKDMAEERTELKALVKTLETGAFTKTRDSWYFERTLNDLVWIKLFGIMDKIAPWGTTFRAHPDNEYNYGFWVKGIR